LLLLAVFCVTLEERNQMDRMGWMEGGWTESAHTQRPLRGR